MSSRVLCLCHTLTLFYPSVLHFPPPVSNAQWPHTSQDVTSLLSAGWCMRTQTADHTFTQDWWWHTHSLQNRVRRTIWEAMTCCCGNYTFNFWENSFIKRQFLQLGWKEVVGSKLLSSLTKPSSLQTESHWLSCLIQLFFLIVETWFVPARGNNTWIIDLILKLINCGGCAFAVVSSGGEDALRCFVLRELCFCLIKSEFYSSVFQRGTLEVVTWEEVWWHRVVFVGSLVFPFNVCVF